MARRAINTIVDPWFSSHPAERPRLPSSHNLEAQLPKRENRGDALYDTFRSVALENLVSEPTLFFDPYFDIKFNSWLEGTLLYKECFQKYMQLLPQTDSVPNSIVDHRALERNNNWGFLLEYFEWASSTKMNEHSVRAILDLVTKSIKTCGDVKNQAWCLMRVDFLQAAINIFVPVTDVYKIPTSIKRLTAVYYLLTNTTVDTTMEGYINVVKSFARYDVSDPVKIAYTHTEMRKAP